MYELKGKAINYIIVVNMWYLMVVILCTTGSNELFSLGVAFGVLPYVVVAFIVVLCGADKLSKWVCNE